jgi:hypothetical protein
VTKCRHANAVSRRTPIGRIWSCPCGAYRWNASKRWFSGGPCHRQVSHQSSLHKEPHHHTPEPRAILNPAGWLVKSRLHLNGQGWLVP